MHSLRRFLVDYDMAMLRALAESRGVSLDTNVQAEAVDRLAAALAEPLSVRAAKRGLRMGTALGSEQGLVASKELHKAVYASEDAREGPRAFAEKRTPVWKGR